MCIDIEPDEEFHQRNPDLKPIEGSKQGKHKKPGNYNDPAEGSGFPPGADAEPPDVAMAHAGAGDELKPQDVENEVETMFDQRITSEVSPGSAEPAGATGLAEDTGSLSGEGESMGSTESENSGHFGGESTMRTGKARSAIGKKAKGHSPKTGAKRQARTGGSSKRHGD